MSVSAANIWLLAPNMGQSTHADCFMDPVTGSGIDHMVRIMAGKMAQIVAMYLF